MDISTINRRQLWRDVLIGSIKAGRAPIHAVDAADYAVKAFDARTRGAFESSAHSMDLRQRVETAEGDF